MENQTSVGDQDSQQIERSVNNQSVQLPEKPKLNYWMVSTVLLMVIILLAGGIWLLKNKASLSQPPETPDKGGLIEVTGVIRTSGLSEEEKQKFGLPAARFQITDLVDKDKSPAIEGYYLLTDNNQVSELLGKCVKINGTVPDEWKSKGKDDIPYARVAFNSVKLERADYSRCNPFAYSATRDFAGFDLSRFEGVVVYAQRPAPDIGYDYQLKLTKPFFDDLNSSGTLQNVNLIDISPSSHS